MRRRETRKGLPDSESEAVHESWRINQHNTSLSHTHTCIVHGSSRRHPTQWERGKRGLIDSDRPLPTRIDGNDTHYHPHARHEATRSVAACVSLEGSRCRSPLPLLVAFHLPVAGKGKLLPAWRP